MYTLYIHYTNIYIYIYILYVLSVDSVHTSIDSCGGDTHIPYIYIYKQPYISIHIYIFIYTHTYTCVFIHIHAYTCKNIQIHWHTYLHTCIHIHIHIHAYSYIYIHIYIYAYTYICIYIHTYIHTYTYTHTCIFIHIHKDTQYDCNPPPAGVTFFCGPAPACTSSSRPSPWREGYTYIEYKHTTTATPLPHPQDGGRG